MNRKETKTVWSSDQGDSRKRSMPAREIQSRAPQQQTVYLHRDSKGRGGKTVTLVKKLVLSNGDLQDLAKKLRQVCGSGGTVKGDTIEIQGEHRQMIARTLMDLGYKVKIAGG